MALIPAKCTQCGANIDIHSDREISYCAYCGTALYRESILNQTNNINANVVNIIYANGDKVVINGDNITTAPTDTTNAPKKKEFTETDFYAGLPNYRKKKYIKEAMYVAGANVKISWTISLKNNIISLGKRKTDLCTRHSAQLLRSFFLFSAWLLIIMSVVLIPVFPPGILLILLLVLIIFIYAHSFKKALVIQKQIKENNVR